MDYNYIDDKTLIEDFKMVIKNPHIRLSMYHRIEELKEMHVKDFDEYRELKNIVDPEKEKPPKKEKKEESVKQINFGIEKVKKRWTVYPDIPHEVEIVDHIVASDLEPGVIKMEKFKLPGGKMIDLSFEMKSPSLYTGSIMEKCSENEKKTKQKTTKSAKSTGTGSKIEDLKTVIAYLKYNETFSDWLITEFFERWKPVIDKGFILNER